MPIHGFPGGVISSTAVTPSSTSASGVWTLDEQFQNAGNWPAPPLFLTNSLRFRSSASAYLNRTPASAGNRKTWTLSTWIKRSSIGSDGWIMSAGTSGSTDNNINFTGADDTLACYYNRVTGAIVIPSMKFRDPSAWYHVIIAVDTTQATASNRVKVYVNGIQVTSFQSATYPSQNEEASINNNVATYIGARSSGNYFDGYLTEINFIDGQALTPSSFGETSTTTGVWQPKKYAGTYGTNGFYLPFTDNSALTSGSNAGLGKDFSGNGNYWTTNNISITSGSTYDSMTDVPTLTSATAANFAVLNPLNSFAASNCSDGNLNFSSGVSGNKNTLGTIYVSSGKYYAEFTAVAGTGGFFVGIANTNFNAVGNTGYIGNDTNSYGYYWDGNKYTNSTPATYGAGYGGGDIIGVALDMDAGTVTFYKNNSSQGTAFTGLSGSFTFGAMITQNGMIANFGQRPFAYTPPANYVALNTYNLPTPTIGATASSQANKYFDATLYTGNGSTQTITNAGGFQPDLVWLKSRSAAGSHGLFDVVRGATKRLSSDNTGAEDTISGVTAFNTNGFSLGAEWNQNTTTFVAWQWDANGTGVTNTAGSITSTVSANTTSGFSVVTYTGNGSAGATFGHGLGVAPSMVIIKDRVDGVADWRCYHVSLGNTKGIFLNLTNAAVTDSSYWNNTSPSSTVVTLGTNIYLNKNGDTYVAYCFSAVAGYSAFGSYTGNGSTDGPFIFCGFRPKYVMLKCSSTTGGWVILDASRSPYNVVGNELYANASSAEGTGYTDADFLSNGFKLRVAADPNASSQTYVFMAFAESPFKYSNAR